MGTTVALQGMGLISGALLARLLGVENRGILAAIILWPSIVAYLGDLGGPVAYTYLASSRPTATPQLVRNAILLTVVQSVFLFLVGTPLILFALQSNPEAATLSVAYFLFFLPLNLSSRYMNAINQGESRFRSFNIARLSVQGSYVLGIGALALLDRAQIGWVLIVMIFSAVVALVTATPPVLRSVQIAPRFDIGLIRDTFRYGTRAHIGTLTPVDSMRLDLALIVLLLSAEEAGLYTVAISVATIVRAQGSALGMVALPTVSAALSDEERNAAIRSIMLVTMVLNLLTAILLVAGAGIFVSIVYGRAFEAAVPIVRILTIGVVAASLRQVLGDCLRGAGQPVSGTVSEIASWLVALVGLLTLVPLLGSEGAAIAVSCSYMAALAVSLWFARRMGFPLRSLLNVKRGDLSTANPFNRN